MLGVVILAGMVAAGGAGLAVRVFVFAAGI